MGQRCTETRWRARGGRTDTERRIDNGDARRQTFFLARIHGNNLAESPTLMAEAELRAKLDKVDSTMSIFTSEKLPQFERAAIRYPSAKVLVRLASDANRNFAQPPLEPIYLREPHITIPKK